MSRQQNTPDHSYVIGCIRPDGHYHETFKIDQVIPLPKKTRQRDGLTNAIQRHLNELHQLTGFGYSIIYEGNPEMAESIMQQERDCPF